MERKLTLTLIVEGKQEYLAEGIIDITNPMSTYTNPVNWNREEGRAVHPHLKGTIKTLTEAYQNVMCTGESVYHNKGYKVNIDVEKEK